MPFWFMAVGNWPTAAWQACADMTISLIVMIVHTCLDGVYMPSTVNTLYTNFFITGS